MNDTLRDTIKLVPEQPGCYLYYDKDGEVIYVGKAKNLKRRVYSYFHKQHDSAKTTVLVSQIEKLEYIITEEPYIKAEISEAEIISADPEEMETQALKRCVLDLVTSCNTAHSAVVGYFRAALVLRYQHEGEVVGCERTLESVEVTLKH